MEGPDRQARSAELGLELESGHSGYVLEGLSPATDARPALPDNTLLQWWPDTDPSLSGFFVSAGSQWGPYAVTVVVHSSVPGPAAGQWEDVVELSVRSAGELVLAEVDEGAVGGLPLPAGTYRARLSARGRSESNDRDAAYPDDDERDHHDGLEPLEHHLLDLWPCDAAPPIVVREESRFARDLIDPPQDPADPADGVAAALAIVRDLRREPGAREVPGRLGDLSVEKELPGTPVRVFNRVRYASGWPTANGAGGRIDAPGDISWRNATLPRDYPGHDQWNDAGDVRLTVRELDKPRRVVLGWNWVPELPEDAPLPWSIDTRPVLLEHDSTVTMTIERLPRSADGPRCRLVLEHRGMPAAWVDDLTTLWRWDLEWRTSAP